jgi:rubrerythrin
MMNETFICETPGCPEEGKTSDSVTCPSCGKARSRIKLKQLTNERGLS